MSKDRVSRWSSESTTPPTNNLAPSRKNGQNLVETTLREIRKRHSSSHRLSSDEIDGLLQDIRRSRSASEGRQQFATAAAAPPPQPPPRRRKGSNCGGAGGEGGCVRRPPPPAKSPPPLPDEVLPFGRGGARPVQVYDELTVICICLK